MKILFNKDSGAIVDRFQDDVELTGLGADLVEFELAEDIGEEVTNVSGLGLTNLASFKARWLTELATSVESYIYEDYPISNQTSLLSIKLNASGDKLSQINAIQSWIDDVLNEYYLRKASVEADTSINDIVDVSKDFSDYTATKPSYTLRTVREASNS